MKASGRDNDFRKPVENLPHLSDVFVCSTWAGAKESLRNTGLPEERFEYFAVYDWDQGYWRILGQARPTFKDKITGWMLWFEMKLRLKWRRARSGRW
jgi:hypothetical protein